jgi:uncharacterized membrane protein YccC
MTTGTILLWALAGVVAVVAVFFVWKLWSSRQADTQYAQGKATADTAVHHALQGKSFSVGTSSDFIEGDLRGHFRWLSAERAWGLRLENPSAPEPPRKPGRFNLVFGPTFGHQRLCSNGRRVQVGGACLASYR